MSKPFMLKSNWMNSSYTWMIRQWEKYDLNIWSPSPLYTCIFPWSHRFRSISYFQSYLEKDACDKSVTRRDLAYRSNREASGIGNSRDDSILYSVNPLLLWLFPHSHSYMSERIRHVKHQHESYPWGMVLQTHSSQVNTLPPSLWLSFRSICPLGPCGWWRVLCRSLPLSSLLHPSHTCHT